MVKGHIVLVEDQDYGESWVYLLEQKDYLVSWYQSGVIAIEDISNGLKYGLLVVDLSTDGREVIHASRQYNPTSVIVSMSGAPFLRSTADYHYAKPIQNLVQIVEQYYPHDQNSIPPEK